MRHIPKIKKKKKRPIRKRHILIYAGQKMKAKTEVEFAVFCDRNGIPWMYESEKLEWSPPVKYYTPDFVLPKKDGGKMFIERKGWLRPEDKVKMQAIRAQYPDLDIRFIFDKSDKPLAAMPRKDGSRMTHGEWAFKHGYPFAETFLPKSWINELEVKTAYAIPEKDQK